MIPTYTKAFTKCYENFKKLYGIWIHEEIIDVIQLFAEFERTFRRFCGIWNYEEILQAMKLLRNLTKILRGCKRDLLYEEILDIIIRILRNFTGLLRNFFSVFCSIWMFQEILHVMHILQNSTEILGVMRRLRKCTE